MRTERHGRRRLAAGAAAAAILLAGLTTTASPVAAAPASVPGTITTWAGGVGEGPALNLSVDPGHLAAQGPFIYIADPSHDAIRVLDTRTGDLRTVAGNGDGYVYSYRMPRGDGELATTVRADQPTGVAVDGAGRVYFGDYGDARVRRVDTAGIITTFAGGGHPADQVGDGGPATEANVWPLGLAFDGAGNLFVVGGGGLRRISTAGIITTVVGQWCPCDPPPDNLPPTTASIGAPAVAVDRTGHVHILDRGMVVKIDDAGIFRRVAGGGTPADGLGDGGPALGAVLAEPAGLAFDAAGNLFIAENAGNRVRKVDTGGTITTLAGGGNPAEGLGDGGPATAARLSHPTRVVAGPDGDVYVSDTYHHRLRRIRDGVITTVAGNGNGNAYGSGGDGGPASKAQLTYPAGMDRDPAGNTYIAEPGSDRVRKVDANGRISTLAGGGPAGTNFSGDGGPASKATLSDPMDVAVDADGNVYIADTFNGRVRKVDAAGIITTVAGGGTAALGDGGPATAVGFGAVPSVAVDGAGNLYLADRKNRRIRRVTPDGTISTFAGGVSNGYSVGGDGGPATSATLDLNQGVDLAFDAAGQLYISDCGAGRVRRVDLAGVISSVDLPARYPGGLAFDAKGSLYVADGFRQQVVKMDVLGHTSVVAGTGQDFTALGDGGAAIQARVDFGDRGGGGLLFDTGDNLFFTDPGNNRVRRVEAGTFEGGFHALDPIRILDTRQLSPIGPGATLNVKVTGRGGSPDWGVSAVALNVTATQPSAHGHLTVFPSGEPRPVSSSLNFSPGQTVANLVVAKVGGDGAVSVYNQAGTTQVVFDIVGWYSDVSGPPGARFNPLVPARILDTRTGAGGVSSPVGPGANLLAAVTGVGRVPATGVSAVVLNVTATQPSAGGHLAVAPSNFSLQESSSVNFAAGQTVPNLVVAKVGPDGKVRVYNRAGTTHVILDVVGWFGRDGVAGGSLFNPLTPARIVDTRTGTGGLSGAVGPGEVVPVVVTGRAGVPSSGVSAVVLNVTVTQPTATGHLIVFPTGAPRPNASNLNFVAGQTVPNLVVAKVGVGGSVDVYNQAGTTQLIFDVVGWY